MRHLARLTAAVAVLALAASATPEAAAAQQISACYTNKNGTMYRVGVAGTPTDCTNTAHKKETWNVQGVPGVSGHEVIIVNWQVPPAGPNNTEYIQTANCPAGKKLLGGGYNIVSYEGGVTYHEITSAFPSSSGTSYRVAARNKDTGYRQIQIYLTCAFVQ